MCTGFGGVLLLTFHLNVVKGRFEETKGVGDIKWELLEQKT